MYFRSDQSACQIEENWNSKIEKAKRTIAQWSRRNLSIYGKILIAKTFLISQFIYIMRSVGIPDNILDKINRALYAFLWKRKYNNKKAFEKVKRRVIAQGVEKGGLGMIDMKLLQEALYLGWVPKLINKSTDKQTLLKNTEK